MPRENDKTTYYDRFRIDAIGVVSDGMGGLEKERKVNMSSFINMIQKRNRPSDSISEKNERIQKVIPFLSSIVTYLFFVCNREFY